MQAYRGNSSVLSQKYMFTVSNLSHELVTPEQYTQLVSTISQYHLIPGFMSDYIDDPWDIVIKLLPYSKNTIIDVTLPYISYLKHDDGNKKNETKILGRYILYKEQVIGIKLSTSSTKASHKSSSNSKQKFKSRLQPIPQKVQTYYVQNNIQNFQQSITVGDFYLITNKFKIALLFQSEITQGSVINPYIMMGCQIVSIVNDEELNYQQFVSNYANQTYQKTVLEGINSVIIDVRKICFRTNLLLLYGGCKTCPSLGKVFFSRSFIQYANDQTCKTNQLKLDSEDVQFYPLIDLSRQKDFISEPQFNSNRLNICKQFNLSKNRVMRHAVINDQYSMNNQCQLQSLQMDSRIFDIRPLTTASKLKLSQFNQMKSIYQRQKLFISSQLNGRSLIKCMYVFNMINLFILSKSTAHKSPFVIGVPFTHKTKNLFDVIVYIFDNIKNYQANAADLEQNTILTDILQLYRFQDDKNINHDFNTEELMLKQITGNQSIEIPTLSELIKSYSKQKTVYLCSEDQQQKKKLKNICKQSGVQINFVDVIMVDQFSVPLQIKPTYDSVLNAEGYQNVLDSYVLKLRQMPTQQQIQLLRIKQNKKQQFPLRYIKLSQQLSKKNFLSIQQALKWIILQKQFCFEDDNIQLFPELIINELGKKVKSNIRILSQINTFFIKNSQSQIIRKVTQMCLQIMRTKRNAAFNSMNSISSDANVIILSDSDQRQKENHQSNQKQQKMLQQKSHYQKQQRQRSPEQLYLSRLQKCKKIKKQKQRKIILKCHRCQTEMLKNMLEKCKQCYQMICLVCIEQLSGISGIKAGKQLSKFCTVCNRTCECDKCKRKRGRMLNESNKGNKQDQVISQEIKISLMVEQQPQPVKDKQINKKQNLIAGVSDFLFKTFSDSHQFSKLDIKVCQKCQILNIGQKRYMTIECIECGKHECYFCVQQRYKQTNYKPQTLKTFYKNWRCQICDKQWQRFLQNKTAQQIFEKEKLMKQQQIKYSIFNQAFDNNMDVQINSNHTSHYAGENLMQNAYFLEQIPKRVDPRLNLNLYQSRSYSQSEIDKTAINSQYMRNNFIDNNLNNKMIEEPSAPFFKSTQSLQSKSSIKDDNQIIVSSVYPLPSTNLASFNSKFDKQKQKKQFDTKGKNNSSDQGYDSKQDKKKTKNSSKIQISFRDKQSYKKQKNTGGPLWGNKLKQNKGSSLRSSSSSRGSKYSKSKRFSSDQESIKSKNESQISFNPKIIEKKKSSVQMEQSNTRDLLKNKEKQRKIRSGKNKDNEIQKSKKKKHNKQKKSRKQSKKKSKRSNSYESGQVQLSSNSSSSSSSSSSKSSRSSRSIRDKSKLKIKVSSSNRSRSKDRNRNSSRSNSSSVRKNDSNDRRSNSNRREQYRGRGRGRGGWNTNYHDRDNNNRGGYSRGSNNWRGNNDRFNNRDSYNNRGGRDYNNNNSHNDDGQRDGEYVSSSSAHYSAGYRSQNNSGYNNNRFNDNSGYNRDDNNRGDDRFGGNGGYERKDRNDYKQSNNNNNNNARQQGGLLFNRGSKGNNLQVSQDIQY